MTARCVRIAPSVLLPPLSTEIRGRTYPHLRFLEECILQAPMLKQREHLSSLFTWQELLEPLIERGEKEAGDRPQMGALPERPGDPGDEPEDEKKRERWVARLTEVKAWGEQVKVVNDKFFWALEAYWEKKGLAVVGAQIVVPESDFLIGMKAAKETLDAMFSSPKAFVPEAWQRKILRLFWQTDQSPAV